MRKLATFFVSFFITFSQVFGENLKGTRSNDKTKIKIGKGSKVTYKFEPEYLISINDKEYDLTKLSELEVFSDNFQATLDGKNVNFTMKNTYWSYADDPSLFLSKDLDGNINYLNIADDNGITSFAATATSPGFLEEIIPSEVEKTKFSSSSEDYVVTPFTHFSTLEFLNSTMNITDLYDELSLDNVFGFFGCNGYRILELAIAFDTTFCQWMGGFNNAYNKVTQLVSMASSRYQQGLCISLRLSALEGNCDYNTDPYKNMRHYYSGCKMDGLLQDFTAFWHYNRNNIPRDAAHLFLGKKFTDGMIGCAGIGTLCKYAYGVEAIPWSSDVTLQAMLFAHELGHNCGGVHVPDPSSIMNSYITHSPNGFSQQALASILYYLKYQSCI